MCGNTPLGRRRTQLSITKMNRIFEAIAKGLPGKIGRTIFVSGTTGAFWEELNLQYPPDKNGVKRVYTTVTLALAACTAGYGEVILLAPDFTTALTATEENSAATKSVLVIWAKDYQPDGTYRLDLDTAVLPAGISSNWVTVTGKVKLLGITGEVTTGVTTGACTIQFDSVPTSALATSALCALTSVSGLVAGIQLTLTGTVANKLATTTAVGTYTATPLVIPAGKIKLHASATTVAGSIKWHVKYEPIDPGARCVEV